MTKAVASRPVEQFDTEVTLPEWQLEPDEESYFGEPDNSVFVDENGVPIAVDGVPVQDDDTYGRGIERPSPRAERPVSDDYSYGQPAPAAPAPPPPQRLDQDWIDRVTGRDPYREQPRDPSREPRRDRRIQPPPPGDDRPYQ